MRRLAVFTLTLFLAWSALPTFAGANSIPHIDIACDAVTVSWESFPLRPVDLHVTVTQGDEITNASVSTDGAPDGARSVPADLHSGTASAQVTNAIVPHLPAAWKKYSPGMAPASTGNGNMAPLDYLNVYWPALTVQLDGCEIHPYGRAADVNQPWSTLGKLTAIRNLTGVPIIASEYNSDWNDSDAVTATNVPKGLDYMLGLGFVDRVFIYAMSDKATDGDFHLGMIDGAGNNRPLYASVAAWAASH